MEHASILEGLTELRKKYGLDSDLEWNRFNTWITNCSQNIHNLQSSPTTLSNVYGLQPRSKPLESFWFSNNGLKLTYWTTGISACGTENENPKRTDKVEGNNNQGITDGVPKAWQDMLDHSHAFPFKIAHVIQKYYGLKDFFVVQSKDVIEQDEAQDILNSLAPLVPSDIPLFVQYGINFYQHFVGTLEYCDFKTYFKICEREGYIAEEGFKDLKHYSRVFKEILGLDKEAGVVVSSRFIYCVVESQGYDDDDILQLPFDLVFSDTDYVTKEFGKDWNRVDQNNTYEFLLCVTCRNQLESDVIDYRNKNFNPLLVPDWSLMYNFCDAMDIVLGYCLHLFVGLVSSTNASTLTSTSSFQIPSKPRNEINAELYFSESRVNSKLNIDPDRSYIPLESLDVILQYLFYEEELDTSQQSDEDNLDMSTDVDEVDDNFYDLYDKVEAFFRSSERPNLITRLAICLSLVNMYCDGYVKAVYQLWDEFVLEMKYRWENSCEITGLESEEPNFGFELLHQKLQMLNCCIKKKKDREESTSNRENLSSRLPSQSEKSIGRPETEPSESEAGEIPLTINDMLSALELFATFDPRCNLEDCMRCLPNDLVEMTDIAGVWENTNKIFRGRLGYRVKIMDGVSLVFDKRKFPEDEEAEKILHELAEMEPYDLVFGFMPLLISLSVNTLLEHSLVENSFLTRHLYKIKEMLAEEHLNSSDSDKLNKFEDLICYLTLIEIRMGRTQYLLDRFRAEDLSEFDVSEFELQKFVSDIIEFGEASFPTTNNEHPSDTRLGKLILKLFTNDYKNDKRKKEPGSEAYPDLPEPTGKEYIFTFSCPKAPDSIPSPQRVYFSCYRTNLETRTDSAITCAANL